MRAFCYTTGVPDVLTFLFTDIEGSTRRWEELPGAMRAAVAQHDELLETAVRRNGGRVFKRVGDALCTVFDAPENAVAAAIQMQRALSSAVWPDGLDALRIRIGIHCGTALPAPDGDFAGPALNRVARLTSAGHGGQVLLSETAATLVRDTLADGIALRSLGTHQLRDLSHRESIFQLQAPGLQAEFPALRTLDMHPNNLPLQISSFIGRSEELHALAQALRTSRLVTIAGPGGIGKTRLSLQAAAQAAPRFKDGCWFVKLADVRDPQLVVATIASVLHIPEEPGKPLADTLAAGTREKQILLLLDNSEHLLPSVVEIVSRLLQECPQVAVLVTSREPTHLSGEIVQRLHSLPDADAVELFRRRAEAAGGSDAQSPASVAAICRQLDGIPLAIELAAARTQTLSAAELESALRTGSELLVSKDPQQAARHRTLSATIAWSYALLSAAEQQLLQRLSVFEGGFTREAAQAVCAPDAAAAAFLDGLDSLVDKSFVDSISAAGAKRFRLLEPIRRFLEQFAGRDTLDVNETRRRHFAYFLDTLRGEFAALQDRALRVDADLPNIRAALSWGIANAAHSDVAEFARGLCGYWQLRGTIAEARAWLGRVLGLDSLTPAERAMLLRRAATFATKDDDYDAARGLILDSLDLYRRSGDAGGVAEATHAMAVLEHYTGHADEAYRLYGDALDAFEKTGHVHGTIAALTNRGMISAERGALEEASAMLERAERACRAADRDDDLASVLSHQGDLELQRKRPARALHAYTEALEIKQRIHSRIDLTDILSNLSYTKLLAGDRSGALEHARAAVNEAVDGGGRAALVMALEILAVVLFEEGRIEESRRALASATALRRSIGYGVESTAWQDELARIRSSCPPYGFEALVQAAVPSDAPSLARRFLSAAPAATSSTS